MAWPASLRAAWDGFWYRPEPALNLAAARIVLAGTALWVVLSRFDLPAVLTFPPEAWSGVTPERRIRFLMLFGVGTERVLYGGLHVTLAAALLGVFPRLACLVSAGLLYHFAPFETVIWTPNPYLRGLTLPTLGLLILAFSPSGDRLALLPRPARPAPGPSWKYRWPLALVQVLFCQIYFFAGYAKLFTSGLSWATADNIRRHLLILNQVLHPHPASSPGFLAASSPSACAFMAWAGLVFELGFPVILFSRAAGWLLVPVAAAFHVANSVLFRIFFQNTTLLLLFVDWDAMLPRSKGARR